MEITDELSTGKERCIQAIRMLGYDVKYTRWEIHETYHPNDWRNPFRRYTVSLIILEVFKFSIRTSSYTDEVSDEELYTMLADSLEKKIGLTRKRYGRIKQQESNKLRPARRKKGLGI